MLEAALPVCPPGAQTLLSTPGFCRGKDWALPAGRSSCADARGPERWHQARRMHPARGSALAAQARDAPGHVSTDCRRAVCLPASPEPPAHPAETRPGLHEAGEREDWPHLALVPASALQNTHAPW